MPVEEPSTASGGDLPTLVDATVIASASKDHGEARWALWMSGLHNRAPERISKIDLYQYSSWRISLWFLLRQRSSARTPDDISRSEG
jgi:hypothetical protein